MPSRYSAPGFAARRERSSLAPAPGDGFGSPRRSERSARVIPRFLIALAVCPLILSLAHTRSVSATGAAIRQQRPVSGSAPPRSVDQAAVLRTYCVRCHNQQLRTAGLALDTLDLSNVGRKAETAETLEKETLEKIVQKLRIGAMPPPGLPRPDQPTVDAFVSLLETELDRAAELHPNPGRTASLHRLNRAEYQNAIRDLLALDLDVAPLLPADDADIHGFDNMAGLLSVSPALLERYMSAARKISRLALGLNPPGAATETYAVPDLAQQDAQASDELPFGSRGGIAIHHYFPVDGEYVVTVRLRRQIYDYITGLDQRERLEVRVDGGRTQTFTIGGESHGRSAPQSFAGDVLGDPEWEKYALTADAGLEARLTVTAGQHVVGVSFVGRFTEAEGVVQPRQKYGDYSRDESRQQGVESVAIKGPLRTSGDQIAETPSRRKIVVCRPTGSGDEESCAKTILARLARRAYRRSVTDREVQTLLAFYRTGRQDGGFPAGIQFGVERILADPSFLFRVERDPARIAPNVAYRIGDLELASRLAFFLWSSTPDDELLDLAVRGKLKDPAVLEQQTRRMLADARSKALVDNFVGQWLLLRNIRSVRPEPDLFPDFDEELRASFQRETELFVGNQLREDRGIVELLSADYTFLNERLARHYQIPNVFGSHFRRVTLDRDQQRGGLIGQGSLLMVTAYPNRTSPVLRGKWVLDSLLGTPPPQPPPDVPSLKDRDENGRVTSVRDRLEAHRKNPACAACHAQMDPLGFALENFDAIGKWRTTSEGGTPIDASAVLPTGVRFQGPRGLREVLLDHRDQFVTTVTQKLLSYALGRGLEYYDQPAVRKIVRNATPGDYRWSSIILEIVRSTPFLMRTSVGAVGEPPLRR
jgi:cytochrome c5